MDDDLENDLILQMVDVVSSELLDESSTKPKVGRSVPRRTYVWRDKEVCHNLLLKDYFYEITMVEGSSGYCIGRVKNFSQPFWMHCCEL